MLDTNMVSYITKGKSPSARRRLLALRGEEIGCVSSITEAEIRYGLAKRPEAVALRALMEGFLASVSVLSWGSTEAEAYGALRAKMESAGKTLDSMDLLIAAHAISVGAVLVTNDKAFLQVHDLRGVENWASDV